MEAKILNMLTLEARTTDSLIVKSTQDYSAGYWNFDATGDEGVFDRCI